MEDHLKYEWKFCLLCFAAFPENAIVRKRLVENWLSTEDENKAAANEAGDNREEENKSGEKKIGEILDKLVFEEFIDPVYKKRRKDNINRFKMHPLARLAVIKFTGEINDSGHNPSCHWARMEGSEKGSISRDSKGSTQTMLSGSKGKPVTKNKNVATFKHTTLKPLREIHNIPPTGGSSSSNQHHIESMEKNISHNKSKSSTTHSLEPTLIPTSLDRSFQQTRTALLSFYPLEN